MTHSLYVQYRYKSFSHETSIDSVGLRSFLTQIKGRLVASINSIGIFLNVDKRTALS